MTSTPDFDVLLDVVGESCPMPLLKAKLRLNDMASGQTLKVIASDQGSVRDFKAYVALTEHSLQQQQAGDACYIHYITKA